MPSVKSWVQEKPQVEKLVKSCRITIFPRGGDLSPKSGPYARARNDSRMRTPAKRGFAEGLIQKPATRVGARSTNHLSHQFQNDATKCKSKMGLFGKFSPEIAPDPLNPGSSRGPRSITVLSQDTNLIKDGNTTEKLPKEINITAHDDVKVKLVERSNNHFTEKHGHEIGINDTLPAAKNETFGNHTRTHTRINNANKKTFANTLEKILQNSKTRVFPNISIRGIQGHGYYTEDYGNGVGFFIGIPTEGKKAGTITKAHSINERQFDILEKFNKID